MAMSPHTDAKVIQDNTVYYTDPHTAPKQILPGDISPFILNMELSIQYIEDIAVLVKSFGISVANKLEAKNNSTQGNGASSFQHQKGRTCSLLLQHHLSVCKQDLTPNRDGCLLSF